MRRAKQIAAKAGGPIPRGNAPGPRGNRSRSPPRGSAAGGQDLLAKHLATLEKKFYPLATLEKKLYQLTSAGQSGQGKGGRPAGDGGNV